MRRAITAFLGVPILALTTLVAAPAAAAACPAPGGAPAPYGDPASAAGDVVTTGAGYGHGLGMTQWGAYGAALLGCSATDIITTAYPGSTIEAREMPATVRVGIADATSQTTKPLTVRFTATGGPVGWALCPPDSPCQPIDPMQPQGAVWRVRALNSAEAAADPSGATAAGAFVIEQVAGDGTVSEVWRGGDIYATVRASHDGTVIDVDTGTLKRTLKHGYTLFDSSLPDSGHARLFVVQYVTSSGAVSGMERYLLGLAEVPSSWPAASLEAQAIAARSYALRRYNDRRANEGGDVTRNPCRCDLYATTADQHYTGWEHEKADAGLGGHFAAAVSRTAGQVAVHGGEIVDARYSASHGGYSSGATTILGRDIAYLQPRDVSRWETEAGIDKGLQPWAVGFATADLAQRFGLSLFESLVVLRTDEAGRPVRDVDGDGKVDGARVIGRDQTGQVVVRWYGGDTLRSKLGTKSSRLRVARQSGPPVTTSDACPAARVPGDRFGDVSTESPHRAAIDCVVWWGIAQGTAGGYTPGGTVTRAQMATFIAAVLRAAGVALPAEPVDGFDDDQGGVHEHATNQLAALGLVAGTGERRYSPGAPVTRAQMSSFLVGAFNRATGTTLKADTDYFVDDSGSVHEASVNQARQAYLAQGIEPDRRFDPGGSVSRAQMASFLARMLERLVDAGRATPPA